MMTGTHHLSVAALLLITWPYSLAAATGATGATCEDGLVPESIPWVTEKLDHADALEKELGF